MQITQKISPFLWFDTQAEEAANFYVSTFPNSSIGAVTRYNNSVPAREGSVMTVTFKLCGQEFIALNGGPIFTFTPAISFLVRCDDQKETDILWEKLTTNGGEESQCGWLKDRYGVSWQIIPNQLFALIADPDPARAHRAVQAMLTMKKIDIEAIQRARDNQSS